MRSWFAFVLILLSSFVAHAQSNELAAEASGLIDTSAVNPSFGGGFQMNYGHRLFGVPGVALYGEIPLVVGLNNSQLLVTQLQRVNYNSFFLTPGVRVKFVPAFPISPYLAGGVGWAHFSAKQGSGSDDEFAADWGGGLDIKLVPFVGLRFEARDFYVGVPTLIPLSGLSLGNQNNVVVSAGVVLRF